MGAISTLMEISSDKRSHPRIAVKLPATLALERDADRIAVEVGNVAPGGIFVKAAQGPAPGSRIELSFRMLANKVCKAVGRVAWLGEAGFGIAFESTNEDMSRFTAQLLKLPEHLHLFYLADVLEPHLVVTDQTAA